MDARLSSTWRWQNEDGTWGRFILTDVYRHAGMLNGTGPNGRAASRPICDFDALRKDGDTWHPIQKKLRNRIPWGKP